MACCIGLLPIEVERRGLAVAMKCPSPAGAGRGKYAEPSRVEPGTPRYPIIVNGAFFPVFAGLPLAMFLLCRPCNRPRLRKLYQDGAIHEKSA
jgi:hypothetical protein